MDFSFSEEQEEVRKLARQILEDLATHEAQLAVEESESGVDSALWKELARANLLGVGIPEAFGGSDMGYLTALVLLEEVGRTVAPIPVLPTLVLGALPLAEFGNDEQKQRLLPGVAAGDVFLTGALQEPGNYDSGRPTTTARSEGDGWRLDGIKVCVPAAHLAARIVVPARTADGAIGLFLVDPGAEGVTLDAQPTTNRERHFRLTLDGARVAADDVLCLPEAGGESAQWLALRATVAYCAVQVGVSDRALRMTADYTTSRFQFERPIGSFQAVHMRAADAFIDVEAMRLTLWQAAWLLSEGRPANNEVSVAKYWAAEGGQYVGYATQHLHGGIGIDVDYPLHRYYLWAKQIELTLGSAPVQLEKLGEEMARERVQPGA